MCLVHQSCYCIMELSHKSFCIKTSRNHPAVSSPNVIHSSHLIRHIITVKDPILIPNITIYIPILISVVYPFTSNKTQFKSSECGKGELTQIQSALYESSIHIVTRATHSSNANVTCRARESVVASRKVHFMSVLLSFSMYVPRVAHCFWYYQYFSFRWSEE
jgi:hypothetical protein